MSIVFCASAEGEPLKKRVEIQKQLATNDVRIKIMYCGMCHSDTHHVLNEWTTSIYPMVPGHEIIGEVVEVGVGFSDSDIDSGVALGDIVGIGTFVRTCSECDLCLRGREQYCERVVWTYDCRDWDGSIRFGGYASEIVVDSAYCVKIPYKHMGHLPRIAPLLCAGVTVYSAMAHLRNVGALQALDVLVVGLGGLGHLAVRYAVAWGHRVSVLTRNRSKDDWILGEGAHIVGDGAVLFDFAIDTIGLVDLSRMRVGGRYVLVGLPEKSPRVDHFALVGKGLTVEGSIVGNREDLKAVLDMDVLADVEILGPDEQEINNALNNMENARFRRVIEF